MMERKKAEGGTGRTIAPIMVIIRTTTMASEYWFNLLKIEFRVSPIYSPEEYFS